MMIYIARADNDIDVGGVYSKIGCTVNPENRINQYNTNKAHVGTKFHYIYRIIDISYHFVEKLFKRNTRHLSPQAFGLTAAGTETRYAKPSDLNEIFVKMCLDYSIKWDKYVSPVTIKKIKKPSLCKVEIQKPLYSYQEETIQQIETHTKGQVILPTGSGKSRIILECLKNKFAKSRTQAVIFVPKILLLNQFYVSIRKFFPHTLDVIVIGSTRPLFEVDSHLSMNPSKKSLKCILKILKSNVVVICTYQSSHRVLDIPFDVAFFDEAHHTTGSIDKMRLFNDNFKTKLFFTATPAICKSKIRETVSMDDLKLYGPVIKKISIREAIQFECLSNFKIVSTFCSYDGEDEDLFIVSSILYSFSKFPIKKMLVYSNTCEHSQRIQKMLKLKTDITIFYIDGTTQDSERNLIFEKFSSFEKCILCNVRVISEGVDLPLADSICFSQPKSSPISIIQNIGRILRVSEKKKMAYVFIPSTKKDFSALRSIIQALVDYSVVSTKIRGRAESGELDLLVEQIMKDQIDDFASIDLEFLEEYLNSTTHQTKSSTVKSRSDLLLEWAKEISLDGTFNRKQLFDKAKEYGLSKLGFSGNTPEQSLSRFLTENMTKQAKIFERVENGIYRVL